MKYSAIFQPVSEPKAAFITPEYDNFHDLVRHIEAVRHGYPDTAILIRQQAENRAEGEYLIKLDEIAGTARPIEGRTMPVTAQKLMAFCRRLGLKSGYEIPDKPLHFEVRNWTPPEQDQLKAGVNYLVEIGYFEEKENGLFLTETGCTYAYAD